jgi:hypothetical protein
MTRNRDNIDAIVVMGDIFDSGRFMNDNQFEYNMNRWTNIIKQPDGSNIPVYYVPGNHDVNIASAKSDVPYFNRNIHNVIKRYEKHFGKLNYEVTLPTTLGDPRFKLVVINAPYADVNLDDITSLKRAGYQEYAEALQQYNSETWTFLMNTLTQANNNKIILLSHIPLYRFADNRCGKYTSTRAWWKLSPRDSYISDSAGVGYSNLISRETTQRIVWNSNIVRIFSGDDHSNCEVNHTKDFKKDIIENTVGTFSFLQGTVHPSVGMLQTLSNGSVRYHSFFLLPQWKIYAWYGVSACVSIFILFVTWIISRFYTAAVPSKSYSQL